MGAPTMGGLMGSNPPSQQQTPSQGQEKARAVMGQIRELSISVRGIAQQFPAAEESARQVADALKQMMVAIVGDLNKTQESPPAPRQLG